MKKTKKLLVLFSTFGCFLLLTGAFTQGFAQSTKKSEPLIISDIAVTDIMDKEVSITWKTSQPCVSLVHYGTAEPFDNSVELDSDYLVTDHQVALTDLTPSTTYSFKIFAGGKGGLVSSDMLNFTTLSASYETDAMNTRAKRDIEITSPLAGAIVSGKVVIQIEGAQTQSFERVDFSVDGTPVGTAERLPFDFEIDTQPLENGSHTVCANGFDIQGEKYSHCASILVQNGRESASFRFVVIGDTRSNSSIHQKVINEVAGLNPKPVMVFNTGDLTASGSTSEWETWKKITGTLGIDWNVDPPQYIGAYGNHDGSSSPWGKYLVGQQRYGDGKTFFISYGKVLFLVLNSINESKKDWIESTLKEQSPKHDWIFAFWHEPPYPFGSKSMDSSYKTFCPILQKYNAKVVFVGHAHYYTRSFPMNMDGSSNPKRDDENGIIQIVAGGAGADLYSISKSVTYKHLYNQGFVKYHYCVVDITNNVMSMQVKSETGVELDSFRLELKNNGKDNPPTVAIYEPKENSTVNGQKKIVVRATDDLGVKKVDLFVDDKLLESLTKAPYEANWNSASVGNGRHTIKAVATDTSDQTATANVTVTVDNNNPNPDPVNQIVASDSFEGLGWKGGEGAWVGEWKKSGDVKKVKLQPYDGKKYARLRAGTGRLERTVDLSTVKNPVLKFAARVKSFETGDEALVKVSSDGVTYMEALKFTSEHSNDTYKEYEIDLSRYNSKSSTFKIVFETKMNKIKDIWYLDKVVITGSK